ncbi:hypothetical protein [Chloroflexus sp.]|uniref:hypothetical protein n=1 Tax=Chloroflexus sp. TaxID=1904827 RepID=UPI002ACE980D|nr:hypothetical protein [Chloroflexus sp.]
METGMILPLRGSPCFLVAGDFFDEFFSVLGRLRGEMLAVKYWDGTIEGVGGPQELMNLIREKCDAVLTLVDSALQKGVRVSREWNQAQRVPDLFAILDDIDEILHEPLVLRWGSSEYSVTTLCDLAGHILGAVVSGIDSLNIDGYRVSHQGVCDA